MSLDAVSERPARHEGSRITRMIFAFSFGLALTLLVFWLMMATKAPWQLNWILAPGAIIALAVGFVTHYGDPWYGLTLLAANVVMYGLLAYLLLSLASGRLSKKLHS